MKKPILPASAALLLLSALPASAHSALGQSSGFLHGLSHPLTGADHLLAMVAVGIWAAWLGGRARWLVPASFVSVMAAAAALTIGGLSIPFAENLIVVSVIGLGLFIAAGRRVPLPAAAALVSLFAIAHGAAHGAEMPVDASGLAYGLGFVAATASLHAAGLFAALSVRNPRLVRLAGSAIALAGFGMAYGVMA